MAADESSDRWGRARDVIGTLRVQTTAAAVLIVGMALLGAAVAMIVLLQRSLMSDVKASAVLRAKAVADSLASGDSGDDISVGDQEEEFVQVVDRDGDVVRSSRNLAGRPAIAALRPGDTRRIEQLPFEDDPFLAVAVPASAPRGPLTVVVGRTLEAVTESTRAVTGLLVVGLPLLLVVVGLVALRVVGRALAPVDAIRSEVEAISTKELHRRVPKPRGKDEIARLAATMNRMLDRLEEGHVRQRRFISDASHELRSPVTTIRQHAEVALSHPDSTSIDELAEVVLAEDVRLQLLVEDLLLLAKMDEGMVDLRRESVDLDDLVFEDVERLRRSTTLRVDTSGVSGGRVSGDKSQLSRLVRNLMDNAARHATSTVAVTLRESDGEIVLIVDDDGEGIRPPDREHIFERFVRLEEARGRDCGGSGLGLAIVAEIAAAHGATVVVLSNPSGGARFKVSFLARTG